MGFVKHDSKLFLQCLVPNPTCGGGGGGFATAVTMDAVQLPSGTSKLPPDQLHDLYVLGPLMYLENTCSFR